LRKNLENGEPTYYHSPKKKKPSVPVEEKFLTTKKEKGGTLMKNTSWKRVTVHALNWKN